MRLPKIDRGGRPESLGRHDINAPVRVAQAKGSVANTEKDVIMTKMRGSNDYFAAMGRANDIAGASIDRQNAREHTKAMSDIAYKQKITNNWLSFASSAVHYGGQIQRSMQQKAVAEGAEDLTRYKTAEAELRRELSADPFRIENNKVTSNEDILSDTYREKLDTIREDILGGIENPRVRDYLSDKFDALEVGTSSTVNNTAFNWSLANNQVLFGNSLNDAIDKGDVSLANDLFMAGVDNGLVSPKDVPKIQRSIESANSLNIFSAQAEQVRSVPDILKLRESLANKEIYGSWNKDQMSVASSALDNKLDEYWIGHIKAVANDPKFGIAGAEAEIRRLSSGGPEEMGYVKSKNQSSMISTMKNQVSNIKYGLKTDKSNLEGNIRQFEIEHGAPISQSSPKDVSNYNAVFAKALDSIDNPKPFTAKWIGAVSSVSKPYTFFPSEVKMEVSRYLGSNDPATASKAADFYRAAVKYNPIAASNMKLSEKQRLFLNQVSGVLAPTEQTIKEIRTGIALLDPVVISDRQASFKSDHIDNMGGYLDDMINDDPIADPWTKSAAGYDSPVRKVFENLVRHKFSMTGDITSSKQEAYADLRISYPLSSRSGDLMIVGPDQPESMYGDKYGMDWYGEEIDSVLKESGFFETIYVSNLKDHPEDKLTINHENIQLFEAGLDKEGNRIWLMYHNNEFLRGDDGKEVLINFDWPNSVAGKKMVKETSAASKARRLAVQRDKQYKRETRMPPPGGEAWANQPGNQPWYEFMDDEPDEERGIDAIDKILNMRRGDE